MDRTGRWSEPRYRSTSQEKKRAREEEANETSGEERCRRVGVSESFRGRRSEEMTQSNASSLWGSEVSFEFQRG